MPFWPSWFVTLLVEQTKKAPRRYAEPLLSFVSGFRLGLGPVSALASLQGGQSFQ
jgi:hypothetical protein